jgi:tRNA 2-thiouridine synthesizing protein A
MPALHRLDVRGTRCPVPALRTARAMGRLAPGERLEVVGDDPAMVIDLPAWCDEHGERLVELVRDGSLVRAIIERT